MLIKSVVIGLVFLTSLHADACSQVVLTSHAKIFGTFAPELTTLDYESQKLLIQNEKKIQQFVCATESASQGLNALAPLMLNWPLDTQGRFERYSALIQSKIPLVTKVSKEIRTLYLHLIYSGNLGLRLARYSDNGLPSVHPNVESLSQKFTSALKAKTPRNDLVFNSQNKTLSLKNAEFDYVIVGSGSAASVIAYELGRKGKSVLVLERGQFPIPGAVDPMRIDSFKEMNNLRSSKDGAIIIRNAFAVGGGPSVNVDLAFSPLLPSVQERVNDWRYRNFVSQNKFSPEKVARAYAWVEEMIGTRKLDRSEINKNNMTLWEGSIKLGLKPSLYDLNRDKFEERHHEITGKRSSLEKLLIPAMTTSSVYLLSDSEVVKLEEASGKVTNLVVRNIDSGTGKGILRDLYDLKIPEKTEYRVKAKNIILSAGTLGSSELLLKSGFQKFNNEIGKGIVIHPSIPVIGEFDQAINGASGLTASVYNASLATDRNHGYILECMDASPSYLGLMIQGSSLDILESVKKFNYYAGFGVMLIDSVNSQNQVTLNKNGQSEVAYELSSQDKVRMIRGIETAVKVMFKAGAKKVAIPSVELGTKAFYESEEEMLLDLKKLELIPNKTILTSAHMQGSNKMGVVVDHEFKFKGLDNLYIVDGSVFPTSVGANPMQSIYTWAKIFSDGVK